MTNRTEARATTAKTTRFTFSILEDLFPPPNFMENMGISLTSKRLRTTDKTGRKNGPSHHEARKLSGTENTKQASEPQTIAEAGVGSPKKLACCLSSRLNFARRRAENAARIIGKYFRIKEFAPLL